MNIVMPQPEPNDIEKAIDQFAQLAQPISIAFQTLGGTKTVICGGLTKREVVATLLTVGILANPTGPPKDPVAIGLTLADALLAITDAERHNNAAPPDLRLDSNSKPPAA